MAAINFEKYLLSLTMPKNKDLVRYLNAVQKAAIFISKTLKKPLILKYYLSTPLLKQIFVQFGIIA